MYNQGMGVVHLVLIYRQGMAQVVIYSQRMGVVEQVLIYSQGMKVCLLADLYKQIVVFCWSY
jgi:hypothetical protein